MNDVTLEKMKQMHFYGMHQAFSSALETGRADQYTPDEFISYLIDHEYDDRQNRKINRHITNARFRYRANLEEIAYPADRNLSKAQLMRLAEGDYIRQGEYVLITGSTGVGKSYLASALGYHACSQGYKVIYYNTAKMIAKLKMAKADASYLKEMLKIDRQQLLILDDFGLQPLDKEARLILMDLMEDRHQRGAMIITSQLPVASWYEVIGEKTVADAILDRLVHNAHRIELKGESMRRKRQKSTEETN
jgi:DNA replication protein DnaC